MNKKVPIIIIAIVAIFGIAFTPVGDTILGSIANESCSVTETVAPVGDDISLTILAENSRRAWAIIAQPLNATNSPHLSFEAGAAATVNDFSLQVPGTTTPSSIELGLNTPFPYTGVVTGITDSASGTVNVIECVY